MGKILTTLRHTGPHEPSQPHSVALTTPPAAPPVPDDEGELFGGEVPFIEIGPRRGLVEGSPDVLAFPAPKPLAPATSAATVPTPRAQGVSLRVLPEPKKSLIGYDVVAYHAPEGEAAAQYLSLLTAVAAAAQQRAGATQVLLFTTATKEDDSSTALVNLAVTAARKGQTVVVVDADLRQPRVAGLLGLEPAPGLTDLLSGDRDMEEVLRPTDQDNLTALTAGTAAPLLADLADVQELVGELRRVYDLVLIDGPRWDGRAACQTLAALADAVFLVSPASGADSGPVAELAKELPGQGVPLAGCVLTGV